jgi:hypothetical protein
MKKLITAFVLLLSMHFEGYAQNCEQREKQLLSAVGGFSAGYLYNTYGMIGSVSDGFGNNVYSIETVNDLMEQQKKVLDNMVKSMGALIEGGYIRDSSDISYIRSSVILMKGLKKQAELMQEYAKRKTQSKLNEYDEQRRKNWKDLSIMMGIDE